MSPCEICKGACCESFTLFPKLDPDPNEVVRWIKAHGTETVGGGTEFKCRCNHLTAGGKCGIYETRPKVCSDYQVGSSHCKTAVLKYRYSKRKQIYEALYALQEKGPQA